MFNSGVSKGNVILWKSRSALLPSFREVINVGTFTCPEKVFPSAHWQIPSDSEIALRLGQPEQQCMQGKTHEDGSHIDRFPARLLVEVRRETNVFKSGEFFFSGSHSAKLASDGEVWHTSGI